MRYADIPASERWWHLPGEIPMFSTVRVVWGPWKGRVGTVVDDWRTKDTGRGQQVGAYHVEFFDEDLLREEGYDDDDIKSGAGVVGMISANNVEVVWRFGDPKPKEATMRTSMEWWNEVLTKPGKLHDWLRRQYHGEASAVPRLTSLILRADAEGLGPEWRFLLTMIKQDEVKHAKQVEQLMESRGLKAELLRNYRARYFQQFPEPETVYDKAAHGAYAELISLTRFKAILDHPDTPEDIRREFTTILVEEEFHYHALRRLAGEEAMKRAESAHRRGLEAVGVKES